MIRRSAVLAALLTMALVSTAFAEDYTVDVPRATPPVLQGGVQQNAAPDFNAAEAQLANDQQWELQARTLAAQQEEAQAGTFMSNPLTFRVTSVGDTTKSGGAQKITALPIHTLTISADGSVDLGQLVDGSGDTFYIPPGTLQKGDLFTRVGNQFVKLPADHFDPMGSIAQQVNQQPSAGSPTALNTIANQLANAADAYKNNAATFANDFLLAAGNVLGNTLQFLAQPRGDIGRPGKPLQDILNYLNNDNETVNEQLGEAAQQAMQTLATHPGATLGNLFMAMLPAGQLGKEAEIAQISQAAQRLTAVENAANDFANIERGLTPSQYPTVPGNAALAHANYPPGGPPPPEPFLPGANTMNRPIPPSAGAAGAIDNTLAGGGDTVAAPAAPSPPAGRGYPSVPGNAALQHANYPPGGPGVPEPYLSGSDTINRPVTPATPPPAPAGDTVATPPATPSNTSLSASARDAQSRQIAAQRSADAARRQAARQPLRPAANAGPRKAIPMTPQQRQALEDNLKKLLPALDQDAQWAGDPVLRSPLSQQPAAPAAPGNASTSRQPDILSTLASRFGNAPKDPLQGAPGLLESRFGIPAPATPASITNALQTAGPHAQGLVFAQSPDSSLTVLNARNNDGQIQFLDPATEKRAAPPSDAALYFYRTR
ncbi:MAG TPA: hypothetical protein VH253_20715 [Phycisphaerae bacterium]|nr:hypothetical protein [Phycisphaerae bacterium]